MLSRFHLIPERHGRPDRRTELLYQYRASVLHHHHHHHHHQVARPAVSIAVSTTERHLERSCARSHAELRPRLVGYRSDSMVRSQVRRGRPLRRRQSVNNNNSLRRFVRRHNMSVKSLQGWKTVDGCLKGTGMILWWISSSVLRTIKIVECTISSEQNVSKVHDTRSNKLRQLSCAIKLLQQLHNCVSNKLPKQTSSISNFVLFSVHSIILIT